MCLPRVSGSLRADWGKREGSPYFQASTHLYPQQIQTLSRCRQHADSHHSSQARVGEEGEGPDDQLVSVEEKKKQDRFEAECIENRRENKVEGRAQTAWPKELQDGGWALPLLALGC